MRLGLTHMGNIDVVVKAIASKLGIDLVMPLATNQHTLSLGVKYSPETVCFPFKLQLGNMIVALELGADTLPTVNCERRQLLIAWHSRY